MEKKHLHILLGATVVFIGGAYLIYRKQTKQAEMAAKGGSASFTGSYVMADGTGGKPSLTAQLNAMNCIQLSQLYNKLKAEYISNGNSEPHMNAMGVVMAHMMHKGCAIDKSGRQNPQYYKNK